MPDDFDPADPPQPTPGNLLVDYQQPPGGLFSLAIIQTLIAFLLVGLVAGALASKQASVWSWGGNLLPAGFFAISAAGLYRRRGWGWWVTCAIYCLLFFNMPVALILWTFHKLDFSVTGQLVCFLGAIGAVAYLNRPEVMRFIRFATPDGRPTARIRVTPVLAGLLGALLRMAAEMSR